MVSLSDDKQADIFDDFNTTTRCLDGILKVSKGAKTKVNINNFYFDNMVKVRKKAKIWN